jgi:simple sugar transport system ATP-binding protein
MPSLLELSGISKNFGDQQALDSVDLQIDEAEAVGLIGDNGAGKSTLVKILSGVYPPSAGEIRFGGELVEFSSPLDARRSGIEMIYQDLALAEDLDIASNIFLGRELRKRVGPISLLDRDAMAAAANKDLDGLGLDIDAGRIVGTLSGGERQMVAVARALQFEPRLLLMDEPTAALSAEKIRLLLDLVAELKKRGVSILLVSHRFTDILHVCDRVVVVRQGQLAGQVIPDEQPAEHTMALMAELMTGESIVDR